MKEDCRIVVGCEAWPAWAPMLEGAGFCSYHLEDRS